MRFSGVRPNRSFLCKPAQVNHHGLLLAYWLVGLASSASGQTQPTINVTRVGSMAQLVWDAPLGTGSFVVEHTDALGASAIWRMTTLSYLSLQGDGTTIRHIAQVTNVNNTTFFRVRQLPHFAYAARTIDVRNVDFPNPHVIGFKSHLGLLAAQPNTGRASDPGMVNFIRNVTYNGISAEFHIHLTISIEPTP